ncbi:uncharacterized protein LOC131669951 [Phymastichus coffea]|uniref:uncharacterized protein LOC131669951 n=1 Tax=Phymastichus coffea TaxID=108790 RepID=UPI00273B5A16|nr:uncharacterized protein LOC131669951 [Phymastichus coffea]
MEPDSIWDENFFFMPSDELDYEFDENELFTTAEHILQETIQCEHSTGVSSFMQPDSDSKLSLHDKTCLVQAEVEEKPILENRHVSKDSSVIKRQDFINSSLFNYPLKSEIKRRDSENEINIIADSKYIIDARILLDTYNMQSLNSMPSNSIPNVIDRKPNSTKEVITLQNRSQQIDKCQTINNTKSSHNSHSKREKLDNFVISYVDKKSQLIKEKDIVKTNSKKKYSFNTHKANFKKIQINDLNNKKCKECRKFKSKIQNKGKESPNFLPGSTLPHVDKKCDEQRYLCLSKEHKLKKRNDKVEQDFLPSQKKIGKDTFNSVKFEENIELNIDKNKIIIEQVTLNKSQVSKNSLKIKKSKLNDNRTCLPKGPNKDELPLNRNNILPEKLESDMKIEPSLDKNQLNTGMILKKYPNDIVLCKSKDIILDVKPVLCQNFLRLPTARVILKKLTEADLRSSANLLIYVKTEINEDVSQQLRLQGKARNKDFIHRYCCKCKSLQVDRSGLSKTNNCENCDSQFIYLCTKCNEKHYVRYYHLQRHLKKCRGSEKTKPKGLESIVLHRCNQCTFKTTLAKRIASHMKNTGHKADDEIDINKLPISSKVQIKREVSNKPKMSSKTSKTRYIELIIKQNIASVASITERYCIQCNKPQLSNTRKPKDSCYLCKQQLQLRCLRCNLKYSNYHKMLYHLRSKCQPNEYKCTKCDYTNTVLSLMQQHVTKNHCNRSLKSGRKAKSEKKHREIFNCTVCSFQTHYQYNLIRHMKNIHKK